MNPSAPARSHCCRHRHPDRPAASACLPEKPGPPARDLHSSDRWPILVVMAHPRADRYRYRDRFRCRCRYRFRYRYVHAYVHINIHTHMQAKSLRMSPQDSQTYASVTRSDAKARGPVSSFRMGFRTTCYSPHHGAWFHSNPAAPTAQPSHWKRVNTVPQSMQSNLTDHCTNQWNSRPNSIFFHWIAWNVWNQPLKMATRSNKC